MSIQKGYLHYRFFNRLFFYTTLLIASTIFLVIGILYAIFSQAMISDSSRNTLALLRKTSYSADVVYNEVDTMCRALLDDSTIFDYMTTSKADPVKEFLTLRRLNDIAKVYPNVYRVGIYNAGMNRYLTNTGLATDQTVDETALQCLIQNNTGYITFIPQSIPSWPDLNNPGSTVPVLTYVVHPSWITEKTIPSGFIIHIQQSYLQDTIAGLTNESSDNIFVMDEKGLILSSSQENKFLSSFRDKDYVKMILGKAAGEGSFPFTIDGQRDLVSFVRSDIGWYFVNIQPYNQLLKNITSIRNLMLVIAVAILLAGTATAFILARRLYSPIDLLLKKLNASSSKGGNSQDDLELLSDAYSHLNNQKITLQNTIESTFPVFRDAYLRSLLNNPVANLPSAPQLLEQLETTLTGACFFVLLIKIDDFDTYRRVAAETEQKVHYFALGGIAHEIIGKVYENNAVNISDDEIAIITQSDSHKPHTVLELAIEELRFALSQNFAFKISAAAGDWVDGRSSIYLSYSTAREYMQYRLFFGGECFIDRSIVLDRLNSPGEYPAELDDQLITGLERLDGEKVRGCVDRFFKTVSSMSYENALTYINQFLITPIKHFATLLNVRGESAQSYYQSIHRITDLPTLKEICEATGNFMLQMLDTLQESKNLYGSQKLKLVLDWINENYCDSNISLEIIADKFEISSGYLGRLIYGITYCHFNDYLNNLRLNKAAELLKSTTKSAEQICREIGISNTNYFYTLFKKQYHTTPSKYRKD